MEITIKEANEGWIIEIHALYLRPEGIIHVCTDSAKVLELIEKYQEMATDYKQK